jgi:hypothetical protein
MRYEEYVKAIIDAFAKESLINPEDFPNLNLYADQATGFLNEKLSVYATDDGKKSGKLITKTMIANYVKHDMMPSPIKKKYTRDHMSVIAMIFYLRSIFQMNEIELLMKPFIDNCGFTLEEKIDFQKLYAAIAPVLRQERARLPEETRDTLERVKSAIWEAGLEDDDTTELFFLLLILAARADAAKFTAQSLMREYFAKPKDKKDK